MSSITYLGLLSLALAGHAVLGLAQSTTPTEPDRSITALDSRPIIAGDVASEPRAYYGKTIQVRSDVTRTFSDHVFTLSDQPLLAAPDVLVLVPNPATKAPEDFKVVVTGTVREFNAKELQRLYPWFSDRLFKDPKIMDRWQRDRTPVLIATSIRMEDGVELARVSEPTGPMPVAVGTAGRGVTGHGRGAEPPAPVTSLGTIYRADDAAAFEGRPISLRAISVQRVFTPDWIVVGTDANHQLLVRLPQPTSISPGASVHVTGVIRKLPSALDDWGLDAKQIRFPQERPIYIVATQVDPAMR